MYLIFGLHLKSICKYQIHIKITNSSGVKTGRFSQLVNGGQPTLRKQAYSEAGQTLALMNEWDASEAYL